MGLTTVGRDLLQAARLTGRLQEAGADDPLVQARLKALRQAERYQLHGEDWRNLQDLVGLSRSTYHRWRKTLKRRGLRGLKSKSRRPKTPPPKRLWSPELLARTEALRQAHPTWGRWRIGLALQGEGYRVRECTVGRILRYLGEGGRVEPVGRYLAQSPRGKRDPMPGVSPGDTRPCGPGPPGGQPGGAPGAWGGGAAVYGGGCLLPLRLDRGAEAGIHGGA